MGRRNKECEDQFAKENNLPLFWKFREGKILNSNKLNHESEISA